ncbi:hypothetical protein ASG89_07485 [Paenibacillus sp. Soil766]|uniref:hypothetical protein n=1 Tax=Paenibacillus sp. Soil766 TaxID=1736404 RepID=UPI00070E9398|nr:hypothetical protein [Paenibacillus sp. Soil766]KRE93331.1 hypothetical protein ASG89_07485 [Paenibacillus sp. Soil766]
MVKLYERSLTSQMVVAALFIFICVIQLIVNISANLPVGFVVVFSVCLGGFLILALIICIDLVQNDAEKLKAKVEFIEEFRIHIRKPNGKLLKVRVKAEEYKHFHIDQTVELLVAKRTSALLTIHSLVDELEEGSRADMIKTEDL